MMMFPLTITRIRGRSSVVRGSEIKSEDPGFDPLAGQVEQPFFPLRVKSCADVLCLTPSISVCTFRIHMCAHVKDPISICLQSVGLTAGGVQTRTHCTQGGARWVALYYGCSLSPGERSPNSPCIALGQGSDLLQSNII